MMTVPIPFTITGFSCFDEIYRSERPLVFRIVYTRVNDSSIADNLTQDTFVKVWSRLNSYIPQENKMPKESFRSWLGTIAKNTALSYIKRKNMEQRYQIAFQGELTYGTFIAQKPFDPEELVLQQRLLRRIDETLGSSGSLEAAKMRILHGYSYQEISDELNIPIGTVMSRIHRARRRLTKNIENHI